MLQAVDNSIVTVCRCWGLVQTPDCLIKACYKKLKHFKQVAAYLKLHYNTAVRVRANRQGTVLRNHDLNSYPFTDGDFVYSQKTPNLCQRHLNQGLLGVRGRECSTDVQHPTYCNTFCCNFGYRTQVRHSRHLCNCHMIWMPRLKMSCEPCSKQHSRNVCK